MLRCFLNPFGICEIHWLDTIEINKGESYEEFAERAR